MNIKVNHYRGFCKNDENLKVKGSIHLVVEPPTSLDGIRNPNGKRGYWVMDSKNAEKILVLFDECEVIENDARP